MNLKSKLFGLTAAAVLSLSMMSGASAATENIGLTANVAYGDCSVSITNTSIDFGTWKWNGMKYELQDTATPNFAPIEAKVVSGSPAGCNVTVSFEGLYTLASEDLSTRIGAENFRGSLFNQQFQGGGGNAGNRGTGTYNGSIQLRSVPDTAVESPYQGTVTVGVTDAV